MSDTPIVIKALQFEFRVVRSKLRGAEARLAHAYQQVEVETALLAEARANIQALAAALLANGGNPPEDEPEDRAQ